MMTENEYLDEYGETPSDLTREWDYNVDEFCFTCGGRMKIRVEKYPYGNTYATIEEAYCEECE